MNVSVKDVEKLAAFPLFLDSGKYLIAVQFAK